MFEEECGRILKENQILLRKMIDIDKRPNRHLVKNSAIGQSLNVSVSKKRYQQINEENFVITIITSLLIFLLLFSLSDKEYEVTLTNSN